MNGSCDISYVEVYHLHILYGFLDYFFWNEKYGNGLKHRLHLANVA